MTFIAAIAMILATTAVGSLAQTDSQPLLFVSKTVSDEYVVVGDSVEFTVTVYNFGRGPATNVTITDLLSDGSVRKKHVDVLSYGESVGLKYSVTPKALGSYPVAVTEVLYDTGKEGERNGKAYSNILREGTAHFYGETYDDESFRGVVSVVTRERYDRLYRRYIRESAVYAFLCLIPILLPLIVYRMEQNQVDLLIRRSKSFK
ncbi:unnamed protein product [Trypanosoma congolense IL3000]|uniref:WGS project CAEQ00000000 data, annotated contig 121 n=1 Tax=Trypanosoma congolense (strain IL3000) TaxID=1068625 RepID=F9W4R6_TRYCI|nr:unnamed protein product [Trypanosoma congolense IL3000]